MGYDCGKGILTVYFALSGTTSSSVSTDTLFHEAPSDFSVCFFSWLPFFTANFESSNKPEQWEYDLVLHALLIQKLLQVKSHLYQSILW